MNILNCQYTLTASWMSKRHLKFNTFKIKLFIFPFFFLLNLFLPQFSQLNTWSSQSKPIGLGPLLLVLPWKYISDFSVSLLFLPPLLYSWHYLLSHLNTWCKNLMYLVSYCCCNKWLRTQWLREKQIILQFCRLEVYSGSYWDKHNVESGLCSFRSILGKTHFLPFFSF